MYDDFETKTSYKYLKIVINALKEPICILGGWAVYFHVNDNFNAAQGRDYLGSRDIDLGFHLPQKSTETQLKESALAQSLNILQKDFGFKAVSFRLVKDIHTERGTEIQEKEYVPAYFRFPMYVDPIVDFIPKNFKQVFGFQPVDEPMLKLVFEKPEYRAELKGFDRKLLLPKPEILIATKLNSIKNRDKEHKKIKDLCDMFALLWYSDEQADKLKFAVKKIIPEHEIKQKLSVITIEDIRKAAHALNHSAEEINKVVLEGWDNG